MIHLDPITLVPVCAHDDLRGLSIRRFLVKMIVRYTQGGLHLSPSCQTMMEFHRSFTGIISTALSMMGFHTSVHHWQAKPR